MPSARHQSGAYIPRVPAINRLIGVYNANGTLSGELAYFVGKRLGRAHCALCDITHGLVRERKDWQACRSRLPVPFDTFHLDDVPPAVRAAFDGAPVVLAQTPDDVTVLLTSDELESCHADPERLIAALDASVRAHGLSWPG